MLVTLLGFPMLVTLLGFPMLVTLLGNVSSVKPRQL